MTQPTDNSGSNGKPNPPLPADGSGDVDKRCTPTFPSTMPGGVPWPKISIVTPSYNQAAYIEQTIRSVQAQEYPSVEHIVIDGGSTDGTKPILERFRDTLAHVISEPDRGQSHAINKGFSLAGGEILTWLNSDDMLVPGALAAMALAFHTSGADVVAGICRLHRDGVPIAQHLTSCEDGPLPLDDLLDLEGCWLNGKFFYQPEVMFTREIWERAGGAVDESWNYSMDYELWLRFAEHGARLHVVGRPIALFRVHPDQKTSTPENFQAELLEVRKKFLERTGRSWVPRKPERQQKDTLRLAFFNDVGIIGGAGVAHGRLAQACAWAGHDVFMIAARDKPAVPGATPPNSAAILDEIESSRPDAVVVGNLHGAGLSADLLARIAARWPTLYFLHDQWLLTGRCAYSEKCTQYLSGCDHTCPTPEEYPQLSPEKISESWSLKRRLLNSACPPLLLGNSRWMCDFARRALSGIDPPSQTPVAPIEPARLGVPLDVFRPHDRRKSREALGLPLDRFIILVVGSPLTAPRKGLAHLASALDELKLPDVLVVGAGSGDSRDLPPIRGMHLIGMINEPRELAMLFSAADVFVGPSLEEAFGQVFIEAAACGTPSIGYPLGGVPEAIVDGVTGRLAAAVEPAALAEAILELYRDEELRRSMGVWSRLHAENTWSLAASYRQFQVALDRAGWRARLGLRPKIHFKPRRPTPRPIQHVNRILADWSAAGKALEGNGRTSGLGVIFSGHDGLPHAHRADEGDTQEWDVSIRIRREITCEMKNARMMDALKSLADDGVQRVAIYGAGQHTWDVLRTLHDGPVEICGILDDRAEGSLAGWPVLGPESADALGAQAVVLSSDVHEQRMWENRAVFESQGIPVVRLYGSETVAATGKMCEIEEVMRP